MPSDGGCSTETECSARVSLTRRDFSNLTGEKGSYPADKRKAFLGQGLATTKTQKQSTPIVYKEEQGGRQAWNTLRVEDEVRQTVGSQIM